MNSIDRRYAGRLGIFKLAGVGLCMGAANIIPGVSGGTIAFLFGIYADLIKAIKGVDMQLLTMLLGKQWSRLADYLPWRFFAALLTGVLVAILSLAKLMSWLLHNKPVVTYAFFFGLILATVPVIGRTLKHWTRAQIVLGLVSTLVMYLFVGLVPVSTPESLWFLFLCGAIAVSTMILPGISGSFVLVILGKYQYIIDCISDRNIVPLAAVSLGCVVGILVFIRLLHWLLDHYHDETLVVLTGMVLGSLRKIWPWKETLSSVISSKGKIIPLEQINHWPEAFSGEVVLALFWCAAGFALAWFLGGTKEPRGLKETD